MKVMPVSYVDAVIVPVGGGGLISGVAFAIKSLKPDVKVYGVQAEGAPSMYRSLHEHKYQTLSAVSTFADGIQVKTPGELTYKLCEEYVDDIVTVTEDETAAAILSLMENQKLVAEGAGAVPVAAALFHKLPIEGKKVVCLVSGGNIDVNILNRVITRGLVMSGRKANLTIALEDKPGQLQQVADIVSRCGSNVVSVLHEGPMAAGALVVDTTFIVYFLLYITLSLRQVLFSLWQTIKFTPAR